MALLLSLYESDPSMPPGTAQAQLLAFRQQWDKAKQGIPAGYGISLHLFYRWKTQGWTRAWGGWDDVTA